MNEEEIEKYIPINENNILYIHKERGKLISLYDKFKVYIERSPYFFLIKTAIDGHLDFDVKDNIGLYRGQTALSLAIYNGHDDTVKIFVEVGADIESKSVCFYNICFTALHKAVFYGRLNIVKYLVGIGADIEARTNRDKSIVIMDAPCHEEETPLMWAVSQGHLSIVEFLVKIGANIEAKSKVGRTVLMIAAKKKSFRYC